jgi:capsular polysaccharide biosynthesis protein
MSTEAHDASLPGLVRRWWWLVAVTTLVAALGAFLVTTLMPKHYGAEARVLVGSLTNADYQQQLGYQQLAQTYASLASTPMVLESVAATLGEDAADLGARVDARRPPNESIILVQTQGDTADDAVALANAVADAITGLGVVEAGGQGLAQVIQAAVRDDAPISPLPMVNVLVAAALGLLLGALVAWILDGRRERAPVVRDPWGLPRPG